MSFVCFSHFHEDSIVIIPTGMTTVRFYKCNGSCARVASFHHSYSDYLEGFVIFYSKEKNVREVGRENLLRQ